MIYIKYSDNALTSDSYLGMDKFLFKSLINFVPYSDYTDNLLPNLVGISNV